MNFIKCTVLLDDEDRENPIKSKWKRGEERLPIVDQTPYLGVEILKNCPWDVHRTKQPKESGTRRQGRSGFKKFAPRDEG